ncbi:MAG TPA: hypothetical protein VGN12_18830 [Pirellulales bacterium]|jgi:hypothetical protein
MEDKRTVDQQTSEWIDAVRPASDDMSQPEFAPLAERSRRDARVRSTLQRSQRLDATIGDVMQDLPVPAGSVERLLGALEAAARKRIAAIGSGATGDSGVSELPPLSVPDGTSTDKISAGGASGDSAPRRGKSSERLPADAEGRNTSAEEVVFEDSERPAKEGRAFPKRSRAGLGALAAVCLVAVIGWLVYPSSAHLLGPDEILTRVSLLNVNEDAIDQQPVNLEKPPTGYAPWKSLAVQPTSWRRVKDFLGRRGVAYQLRSAKARATLYVIDADAGYEALQIGELLSQPPDEPYPPTGGKAMSVWRSGKLVYVLVVSGGAAEYKSFITAGGQLARAGASSVRRDALFSEVPLRLTNADKSS